MISYKNIPYLSFSDKPQSPLQIPAIACVAAMATSQLRFSSGRVPIIDVHFHYFAPEVLKPMGEFVIAEPHETDIAMKKLVRPKQNVCLRYID